ncbi:MAG: outer membrane beta-barrel protein [Thermodesulfobacteriota bacterium]
MNLIFRGTIAILFMIGILLAPTGSAVAQTRPFYIGVFGGYTIPQNMTWESKITGESLNINVDNTGMIGFKFGYILPPVRFLALEFEYNHIFEHNYGPAEASGVREAGDVYLDNFFFNLLLRYPKGRIHPYVGGGIGWSYFNIKNLETFRGFTDVQEESNTAFAWQFLGGVNFEIVPNISVDLTYRYFGTDPHLSVMDVEYRTSVISAGLNFHF